MGVDVTWLEERGSFLVRIPFGQSPALDAVKGITGRFWSHLTRGWVVPASEAKALGELSERLGFEVSEAARKRIELLDASEAATADELTIPGLRGELRPFQRAGVRYALATRRCFIADDMGLGKTIEAIAAVHAAGAYPAVVVCPAVVKEKWAAEIKKWSAESVTIIDGLYRGEEQYKTFKWASWYVINYDILHSYVEPHFDRHRAPLERLAIGALVLDESHYIKELTSRRYKACFNLGGWVRENGLILELSGTPIKSAPRELIGQLSVMRRLLEFGGQRAFEDRYCGVSKKLIVKRGKPKWVRDASGGNNLEELNALLRQRCMIRRRKVDVLKELPPKVRALVPTPCDLGPYREFRDRMLEQMAETAGDPSNEVRMTNIGLVARLRNILAECKLPAIIDAVDDFFSSAPDEKLVVFCWHKVMARGLAEHYGCGAITGEIGARERHAAVQAFQTGPERLIVCQILAGGVGIDLYAASNAYFAELAWTPADLDQAEDREHRIGQHDSVTAWYHLTPGTLDDRMWRLLERKRNVVGRVTDGIENELVAELVEEAVRRKREV